MPKEQNLFYSAGFFWKKDHVNWRANKKANLLGHLRNNKKAVVNFREQAGIYVLYSGFTAIYAGQVGYGKQRLFTRLKQHAKGDMAERWDRFSWFGVRDVTKNGEGVLAKLKTQFHPPLKKVLNHLEAVLLYAVEPSQNLQSGRLGKTVKVYAQVRDSKLPPDTNRMLKALCEDSQINLKKIK
jgi:hypothetical protein